MKPVYVVGTQNLYTGKLTDYAAETAIAEALAVGATFGTWIDGGKLYIDKIQLFRTKRNAVEAGIRYRQLAIFKVTKIHRKRPAVPEEVIFYTRRNGGALW